LATYPGKIATETSMERPKCRIITEDPCKEKEAEKIIEREQNKFHLYNLYFNNCYDWTNKIEQEIMN